jgi:hypothetical protein
MPGRETAAKPRGAAETAAGTYPVAIDLGVLGEPESRPDTAGKNWSPRLGHRLATFALAGLGAAQLVGGVPPRVTGPELIGDVTPAVVSYEPLNPHAMRAHAGNLGKPALSSEVTAPPMDMVERDCTRFAVHIASRVANGYNAARLRGDAQPQPYTLQAIRGDSSKKDGYIITEHTAGKAQIQVTFGADDHGALRLDELLEVGIWDASGGFASLGLIANDDQPRRPLWWMVANGGTEGDLQTVYMSTNGASLTNPAAMEADLEQLQALYP